MNPRKAVLWVLGALMAYFVIAAPEQAAAVTRDALSGIEGAAQSGTQFLQTFTR